MTTKITIDPITRIMGPLSIEVEIKKNKIVDAKSGGIQFRGFEKMLIGRPPLDAVYFTERICGICSTSHGLVASLALEDALKVTPNENGVRIRNFAHGAEYLQNIMRQICIFVFPDYVNITMAPGNSDYDFRLSGKYTEKINKDYVKALECSRLAHEIVALIGGKAPHNHGVFVGGTTANMDASKIIRLKSILQTISEFMCENMVDDINIIAHYYPEYFKIGGGTRNLLSYGLFHDLHNKEMQYVQPSSYIDGDMAMLDVKAITESSAFSWYKGSISSEVPSNYPSETDIKKQGAYTFIKAPRYKGKVVQVGPLARMILSGSYKNSISTMDRLMARVLEGKKLCEKMFIILEEVEPIPAVQEKYIIPESAQGIGLCDAVRGALGHWTTIEKGIIKNCDIVTPTAWNLSPMDEIRQHGALESALIGSEIQNPKNPVEIGRIVRSFDPCISCATHVNTEYGEPYYINVT
ncbi:nickel-dependent hydrogenase large subunit [Clostridium sp. CF011]|uniref:nickel-dependent hydrogenase large subunit n=1 Tax=unclassified Clostridium TaxID=2614128 RepID=UPI001C0E015C|nr:MULTISPECIES: nickel-dependent hydrogenase large subunit [unclassified Clostridium]MBU3091199.1 nickel-dependent hydrogenase large subunit [Clostridium sp. CF011]MBW9146515.1 nickel-dependent hydrogenase large subunit [Clostridium sp. CM027]UVE39603.1 nickel-dependent hydrogenase large subunit [Clostridium sp. CM027]WAG68509.1 nickel-dependent hydrogenase large subunit [Clostridium sp. CF011]